MLRVSSRVYIPPELATDPGFLMYVQEKLIVPNAEYHRRLRLGLSVRTYLPDLQLYELMSNRWWAVPLGCLEDIRRLFPNEMAELEQTFIPTNAFDRPQFPVAREVQDEIMMALNGYQTGTFIAPTGAGKTMAIAMMMNKWKQKTLVLTTRQDLAVQLRDEFIVYYPKASIGICMNGKMPKFPCDVHVGVINTMNKLLLGDQMQHYGMVLIDEEQYSVQHRYRQLLDHLSCAYRYGFTAETTRPYKGHMVMYAYCGPVRYKLALEKDNADEIVRKSSIKKPETYIIQSAIQMKMPTTKRWIHGAKVDAEDDTAFITALTEHQERNQGLVKTAKKLFAQGRKLLIGSDRVEHVKALSEELADAGCNVECVYSKIKVKERKRLYDALRAGTLQGIVATYDLIAVGLNIKVLDTLLMATPKAKVNQVAGRILREAEGKVTPWIIDVVDVNIPKCMNWYECRRAYYAKWEPEKFSKRRYVD